MPSSGLKVLFATLAYACFIALVAILMAIVIEFFLLDADVFVLYWMNVSFTAGLIAFVLALLTVWRFRNVLIDHKALHHASTHDYLTGAGNRAYFFGKFESRPSQAMNGAALIAFDVDDFKQVNDALGHHAGDEVLVEIVRRVRASLPETARIARFGGDEFMIFLPAKSRCQAEGTGTGAGTGASADLRFAVATAETVCRAISGQVIATTRGAVGVSVSMGVAPAEDGKALETLLRHADAALYQAKRDGGNRVVCHVEGDSREETVLIGDGLVERV